MTLRSRVDFVRLLSSAVTMQALLSGSSFLVGLILVRRTTDADYGYYVLATNALMLGTIAQQAFIQPPLVARLAHYDAAARAAFVGGTLRGLCRLWPAIALSCSVLAVTLLLARLIEMRLLILILAATAAVTTTLSREFFRNVLLAYRRPNSVLGADALYVSVLISGAWIASLTAAPASTAMLTLSIAAVLGTAVCARALWRFEPWDVHGPRGVLREIAPLASWSVGGAAIHWLFSQGYSYVVAGTLDIAAVAAIAAMRLLIMPINLLSTGLGSIMLPSVSTWLNTHSTQKVLVRQFLFSLALAATALAYLAVIWACRNWIFSHVFKKSSPAFDILLFLWALVALLMLFRDQLIYLLVVRGRFRSLAGLTFASAVVALISSYVAMHRIGVAGALSGVLLGEIVNVSGILYLCFRETRLTQSALVAPSLKATVQRSA